MQPTSLEAYEKVKKTLGKRQAEVLSAFRGGNATNAELADYLRRPINTITPRTNELVKKGLVKEYSKRWCAVTGHKAIAWYVKQPDGIRERQLELRFLHHKVMPQVYTKEEM